MMIAEGIYHKMREELSEKLYILLVSCFDK